MYIYQSLIFIVFLSGFIESISEIPTTTSLKKNLSSNQYQQEELFEQQNFKSLDNSHKQPYVYLKQQQQQQKQQQQQQKQLQKTKNLFQLISTIEQNQFDKNQHQHHQYHHHHQNQFNHQSSNMDKFNIIQDLNQSIEKNEQKNKLTTNTNDKTINTTNTTTIATNTTIISNSNNNNHKTTDTISLKRRKKSLSQSSVIGASSISSLKASLNDNNYDNNHDKNNNDDIDNDNNDDDDYDYYYKKNLNTVEELSSEEESSIHESIPNENYAYEDIIENQNNNRENLNIISSNRSSNTNLNEPKQLQEHSDEKNEQFNQWQDNYEKQQQYHSNNHNYIKESGGSSSSSRNDDDHDNNNNNNNNNKITSNDQPYMMHSRVKPPHSSQINKLLYTNEYYLKQGKIKGIVRTFHPQSGLRDVNQFLGIPYAEAPVGSRRFLPPGVPLPWSGLKISSHLPPVCPQNLPNPNLANVKLPKGRYDQLMRLLPYLKNENEDCLYLNVYVPQEDRYNKGEKYPVIVYIHGESYEWNSGNPYDGSVLASYGQVIVVTINYRLGILGFMKPGLSQTTVSNFGLFDQIAALKWIKDNIESFGGDSNRVTLMGHSTGASCVNLLMVSPVANGLFHRAILMSGSAMADWATTNHSLHLTMQIANGVNCFKNDNDDEQMLKCLRSKRYKDFLKVPTAVPPFVSAIGPIVDEIIIPTQPYKMMSHITETFGKYDLLFGVTELESYHILDSIALDDGLTEKERDQFLRLYMNSRYEIRPDLAVAATLKQYMDVYNNPLKATKHEHRDVVLDILSDARIVGPLLQTGLFHADVNPRNYMYVFGHNSEAGPYSSLPHSVVGEELAFVFGAPLAPAGPFHQKYSTSEKLLSEAVMTYWTNFAKTGNPKAPWKGGFINSHRMEWAHYDIDWPEFNKRNQCYVNIGIPPSLEMKYRNIYMNFWNKELPNELNEIAAMQTKPKIHFYPSSNNGVTQRNNYNRNDEIIAGHIQKFPTNGGGSHLSGGLNSQKSDNPIHELKMLMKEDQNHLGYDGDGSIGNSDRNGGGGGNNNFHNNNGYSPVDNMLNAQPTFGITHYKSGESSSSSKDDSNMIPIVNYANEPDEVPKDILRSESALHILIGLIVLFLILNIIIYSTFLFKRKKKNSNQLNRKLGAFISYDGTNDEDLKRSNKTNDCDDSYIMDMVKRSNGYDYVKGKSLSINGFKFARQLSTSTVDAHTKVSDWMSNDIDKNSIVTKSSLKTSPSFSLKGRSFLRRPHKVSVAIDATPQARSDSILRQEPIEISKYKDLDNNTRSIIICQEIDVDADMLEPDIYDNGQDMGAYGYAVIRKDLQNKDNRFNGESQYIAAFNAPQTFNDEQVTSFIDDNRSDVNITTQRQHQDQQKFNKNEKIPTILENRSYQNIILPNVINNDEQLKRQSLPSSSYGSYILNKMPPAPPPRTISTLGRKPSTRHRENSVDITTSPLAIAKDSNSDEPEDLPITENTLIVGPLLPKTHESIYSTLKKKSQQKENKTPNKIEETEEISTEFENENENNENSIKIEICAENFNDKLKSSDKKPSGIKPPTIFPLKTAAELKEQILNRTLASTNANGVNNITRMSLLGMAKSNKNSLEKSKIPQLMTTPENRSHKYRDKSKSIDSSSSESSSSTETVKTELKQVIK